VAQTEKKNERSAEQSKLEQGAQLSVLALLMLAGYKLTEGSSDVQRMFALLTVALAVASTDRLVTYFRERNMNN
jgi:hypothetical protein